MSRDRPTDKPKIKKRPMSDEVRRPRQRYGTIPLLHRGD
jgi:hypothetical protein